jgi:hypothetical protein
MRGQPALDGLSGPDPTRRELGLRFGEVRVGRRELVHALPRNAKEGGDLGGTEEMAGHSWIFTWHFTSVNT